MKLHTTTTMRIVCAIFDYSSYLPIVVGAQSTWGITRQAIFAGKYMRVKLTKCPNFTWYLPKKYFSWFYLEGIPSFPTPRPPMYFLSSTSVVQITRNFAHVTVAGFVHGGLHFLDWDSNAPRWRDASHCLTQGNALKSSKDGPTRLMKRRFDMRCTPSWFHSEEHITWHSSCWNHAPHQRKLQELFPRRHSIQRAPQA